MVRKHKAATAGLPHYRIGSKATGSEGHTPTIGSASRQNRFAIALGLISHDRTQNRSQMQPSTRDIGALRSEWDELGSMEHVAPPDPKLWTSVEVEEDDGPSEPLPPGMKKTTWNVRRERGR